MLLHLIARGKIGRSPEAELVERYLKRITWPTKVSELPDRGGTMPVAAAGAMTVVLDERGTALSSVEFAKTLEKWRDNGARETRFLIGAADAMPMLTPAQLDAAAAKFDADPRDTATPLGFAEFLARIDKGDLLKPASAKFLIDTLTRTTTGPDRIKGGLPAGTLVAHKTGTLHGVSDDVALGSLPDGRRVAIAAFTRGIGEGKARAKIIADAARAIYDDSLAR